MPIGLSIHPGKSEKGNSVGPEQVHGQADSSQVYWRKRRCCFVDVLPVAAHCCRVCLFRLVWRLVVDRSVTGILKGHDQLINLVLDDTVETLRDPFDPYKLTEEKPDVTYKDVGGSKEAVSKIREVVEKPMRNVSISSFVAYASFRHWDRHLRDFCAFSPLCSSPCPIPALPARSSPP